MNLVGLSGFSAWLVYNKIVFSLVFLRRFNVIHDEQLTLINLLKECETVEDYKAISDQLNADKFNKVFYNQSETIDVFKDSSPEHKETMLLEALTHVRLEDSEVMSLLSLHRDKNGVEYSKANVKNIKVDLFLPLIIESLIACSEINVDFSLLSDEENRILKGKKIGIKDEANELLINSPDLKTGELIALSVKSIIQKFKKGVKL